MMPFINVLVSDQTLEWLEHAAKAHEQGEDAAILAEYAIAEAALSYAKSKGLTDQ